MAEEKVPDFTHSLKELTDRYSTYDTLKSLPYSLTSSGPNLRPVTENVIQDVVKRARAMSEEKVRPKSGKEFENATIEYFLAQGRPDEASQVAASLIFTHTGQYRRLEEITVENAFPFNFDEKFQRKLLDEAAQHQLGYLKKLDEKYGDSQGIRAEIASLEKFIPTIYTTKGEPVPLT